MPKNKNSARNALAGRAIKPSTGIAVAVHMANSKQAAQDVDGTDRVSSAVELRSRVARGF